MSQPVLVDFWAALVRPLQGARPVLEKLETDYAGRFSWSRSTPTTRRSPAAAPGVRRAQHPVLRPADRTASRSTASSARCPKARCASSSTSTCRAPSEAAGRGGARGGRGAARRGRRRRRARKAAAGGGHRPGQRRRALRLREGLLLAGRVDDARKALRAGGRQGGRSIAPPRRAAAAGWRRCEPAPAARPRRRARRGDRRQQARLRRPLRARPALLRRAATGPAAMDELLEILMRDKAWNDEPGAQDLHRDPRVMSKPAAPGADGGRGAEAGRARGAPASVAAAAPADPVIDARTGAS